MHLSHTDHRMDEFNNDAIPDVDEDYEEMGEDLDVGVEDIEDVEAAAQRASDAADMQKIFKQHPEVWIPYEEQVQEKLLVRGPDDPNHTTYPRLTLYEYTKIISFRASYISNGGKPSILVPDGVTDAYQIAKMELQAKRLPYILKRPLPNGRYEYWRLADLLLPE